MNKKVGLLTFQDTSNFGSALQTYGLWKKVIDLGYDCEIIDYICETIHKNEMPFKISLSSINNIKQTIISLLFGKFYLKKHRNIYNFFKAYAKLSDKKYYKNNIKNTNKLYNYFLIGSDIVWNTKLTGDDFSYFLDFASENKVKFSYAASIGDEFNSEQKEKISNLINKFDNVSVREIQSKEWIEELYKNKSVNVVCDPTMLLNADEWKKFVGKRIIDKKYVIVYFDSKDNKCLNDAINYARLNNYDVYYIHYGLNKSNCKIIKPTTINEFLSLIFHAEHVFTASYHGLLFSLYFNKPFLFYNSKFKSRMESLSQIINFNNQNGENIDISRYSENIDWDDINKNIVSFRNKSTDILKNMLEYSGDKNE